MSDRFLGLLGSVVDRLMHRVDYMALYPAVVVVCGSGTVDVDPDTDRIPSLSSVPIRTGVPGATATVTPGCRVLIGFDDGDPNKPFAALWDATTALSITLTAATITLAGNVSIASVGGLSLGSVGGNVSLTTTAGDVTVNTTLGSVVLGDGGAAVARVGDAVAVDPGTHVGTITSSTQSKVLA